jgi:hypothetical protein
MTIFNAFIRTSNLFYLAILIVMLVRPDLSPFYRSEPKLTKAPLIFLIKFLKFPLSLKTPSWIMVFQYLFFMLVFVAKELILEVSRSKFDKFINERKVMVKLNKIKK